MVAASSDSEARPNVAREGVRAPRAARESRIRTAVSLRIRGSSMRFGPRRMFWELDLTRLPCSLSQAVTHCS